MQLFKRLFLGKQSSIGSAAFILMMTVLFSRILGLLRDRLLAGIYPPDSLGIYFAAFRLPNMMFDLLVTGVLTTAFIPVFTRLLTQKGKKAAWRMASTVINYAVLAFGLFSIPFFFFANQISAILAPGFSLEEQRVMANFTRVMIVFQVFPLMLGNFLTGMLQSYQLFFIPALAPIVYNIGTIVGIIFFSSAFGLWAPVIGIIIGAFLFLFIQIPALYYLRFQYSPSLDKEIEGVKETGKLMIPRTIGLGVSQIETTIDLAIASLLGTRMITIFHFAQHLQQLPIGLFGATIAQAVLPKFSRSYASERKDVFRQELCAAVHQILFFVLPLSILFIVLRIPITRLVFGSNEFDWEATVLTAKTLAMFSISLCPQALIHVLARAFYALYDTRTPVAIGIIGICLNVFFSLVFIFGFQLPIWGLGLSTSVAAIIHATVLLYVLQRRIGKFSFVDIGITPGKIAFASFVMGAIIFILQRLLDQLVFDTTRTINLMLFVGTLSAIAGSVYFFLSWVLGVDQLDQFLRLLKKLKKIRMLVMEQERV
jgi:putative peptidoglycan lipid II flippase